MDARANLIALRRDVVLRVRCPAYRALRRSFARMFLWISLVPP
jgi:hypothetical protein